MCLFQDKYNFLSLFACKYFQLIFDEHYMNFSLEFQYIGKRMKNSQLSDIVSMYHQILKIRNKRQVWQTVKRIYIFKLSGTERTK